MRRLTVMLAMVLGCEVPEQTTPGVSLTAVPSSSDVVRYRFAWTIDADARMPGVLPDDAPVASGARLGGELDVRVLGPADDGTLLAIAIVGLPEHELTVAGQNVLREVDQLVGHEALVVVHEDGAMGDVWFAEDSPPIFRHVMAGLLVQTDLRVAQGRRRVAAGSGLAEVEYAAREDGTTLRTLLAYDRFDAYPGEDTPRVRGTSALVPGTDGLPQRIDAEEIVWIPADAGEDVFRSATHFSLERQHARWEPAREMPALDVMVRRSLDAPPDDDEGRRMLAQRFAGDLQLLDVTQAIRSASAAGLRPRAGFMVETTGLLRGWPELAAALEDEFYAQGDHRGRLLTADILAAADTPEAQAVLCGILADDDVRASPEYDALLQRLSALWRPTPSTARFLLEAHARALTEGDTQTRLAILYPLGTVAGRVAPVDPTTSLAMQEVLDTTLEHADDAATTVAALAGIGNLGDPHHAIEALAYTDTAEIDVRAQAASSLRWADGDDATRALFELLGDGDPLVARTALAVLDHYRLDRAGSAWLAAHAINGAVHADAASKLVSVLGNRRDDDPSVRLALAAMRERTDDPQEQARIDTMLQ